WFQSGQDLLPSYYLGVGVLALGLIAMCFARPTFAVPGAAMSLFCWIMALGPAGHLYHWLKHIFPVIGFARYPIKFAIMPAFLIPLVAAWGIDYFDRKGADRQGRSAALIVSPLLIAMAGLLIFARVYPFPHDDWHATALNTGVRAAFLIGMFAALLTLSKVSSSSRKIIFQAFI